MIKPARIFIVGHMGAGKFLLAEALAKKLNRDHLFEEVATLSLETVAVAEDVNKIMKAMESI